MGEKIKTDTDIVDRLILMLDQFANNADPQYKITVTRENLFDLISASLSQCRKRKCEGKEMISKLKNLFEN